MRSQPELQWTMVALIALLAFAAASSFAGDDTTLVIEQPQVAGICGLRALWDTPLVLDENGATEITDSVWKDKSPTATWFVKKTSQPANPGAIAFDALQRSLLVRFPGAAEKIAEAMGKGYTIKSAEVVLPFKDTELWPPGDVNYTPSWGYGYRANWNVDKDYRASAPQWHAVAWALRKPWTANATTGPTFNAFINGAGYWSKYGAQDTEHDRYPLQFGPAEVSIKNPEGHLDVTAALSDVAFGKTVGERLRQFSDNGLLIKKLEVYDNRYYTGVYEWGTATGGRGVLIHTPKLIVTLQPAAKNEAPALQPACNIEELANKLKENGGGKPTAVIPTHDELKEIARKHEFKKPDRMPDWQWTRIQELASARNATEKDAPFWCQFVPKYVQDKSGVWDPATKKIIPPSGDEIYGIWIDSMLGLQPRGWHGFEAAEMVEPFYVYRDAIPAPALDALTLNWTAWLMPDRKTSEFVHPQDDQFKKRWLGNGVLDSYYEKTGDWRGNKSFYRNGYTRNMSTMNFNHTSASGALLGGNIIGSQYAMDDGRFGFEHFPLRLWSWYDGTTQESVDHYYLAITLKGQKLISDFGPTPFDRMMGRSMLAKTVDELASCYHPGLKRFIAGSSRTCMQYLVGSHDGVNYVMHTLSHSGALLNRTEATLPGKMPVYGQDYPPEQVARDSVKGEWAPDWVSNTVDEKPLPFEMTSNFKKWGDYADFPIYHRTYLGHHYGLFSSDLPGGRIQIMGQWRREDKPAATMQDLVTMNLVYGANQTRFQNTGQGGICQFGNSLALQHKNKMIVVTSPYKNIEENEKRVEYDVTKGFSAVSKDGLSSLQSSIGLFNYQAQPTWEFYVDGQRMPALPFTAKAMQRITIKDGVSYFAVIPLPATDLGRTDEIVVEESNEQEYRGITTKAAAVINSYNLKSETPLQKFDWKKVEKAYGGFVIELGDATEYADFAAFQKHIAETKVETRFEAENSLLHVSYKSGDDLLESGCYIRSTPGGKSPDLFSERKVNGAWPYLPKGIDRDSPLAQQGTSGHLEKNGAVLNCEPGRMAYLQTEPISGTYSGFNPFPDPTLWSLSAGGVTVKADGRLGMARVTLRPKENKVWIEYALKENQTGKDMATTLLISGLKDSPTIELNGKPVVATAALNALAVPLLDKPSDALEARFKRAEEEFAVYQNEKPDVKQTLIQDWYVAGPFPNEKGAGFDTEFGPEKDLKSNGIDVKGSYDAITWQRSLAADKPATGEGYIDLLPRFKPNLNVCAYAYTTINSDRDRDVTLYAGSDDTITAWVNGEKVLANNVYRGATMDSDRAEIKLRKGANTVLLKICQGDGGWGFFFRLGDDFGLPIKDGLKYGFDAK